MPDLIEILLVEDSVEDVELTRMALGTGKVLNRLHVVRSGEDALRFLKRESPHAQAPRPDLVLLDLNMPRMSGREVLIQMKDDPEIHSFIDEHFERTLNAGLRPYDEESLLDDVVFNSLIKKASVQRNYFAGILRMSREETVKVLLLIKYELGDSSE